VLPTKDELPLHSGTQNKKTRNTSEVAFISGKPVEENKTSINSQTLLIFIADGAPGKPMKQQNTEVLLVMVESAGRVGQHFIGRIKQILPCDWVRTQYAQKTRYLGRNPSANYFNIFIASLPGKQVLKADTSLNSPLPQALMAATRNL